MKIKRVLLLFFLITFFQNADAQINPDDMESLGHRYYYQDKIYNKREAGKILEKNEKAYELFKVSHSIRKKANIAGFTSLGLIVLGIGSIERANNRCRFTGNCPWYGIGVISFITSCAAGTAGLVMKRDAKVKMNNSLDTFNDASGIGKLDLKIDDGKIGFILTF